MRRSWARIGALAAPLLVALAIAPAAAADAGTIFAGHTVNGQPIPCTTQSDGVRVCHGDYNSTSGDTRLKSFDSSPLEVYVILPPGSGSGPYPLIVQSHGWGSHASGPGNTEYYGPTGDTFAKDGYAVLQLTARGFGDSCGSSASRVADPTDCANGYIRLDDDRYEVRDAQNATGLLVDEGIVAPGHIGVTGESYGGGVSLALATLKDRIMNPDGTLSPWRSPAGTPLSITAAAPVIPWSDLVYSLTPNGRTLDTKIASPTTDLSPVGVEKQSFVTGLYGLGQSAGYYAAPGTNSEADLTTWYAALSAGEPPSSEDSYILDQVARYHSAYYLLDGAYGAAKEPPAPLLFANGFTDDLFPVDEAVRYYNLERSLYPSDPVGLIAFDGGHERGQNKPAELSLISARIQAFMDQYVKGTGTAQLGATALTQTCPSTAPAGGPFSASTWVGLHPGEVDYHSNPAQTITSGTGNPAISAAIDPIAGQGACATVSSADQGSGVATYRLPAATGGGYTLLGAPLITAKLTYTGSFPVIAERLWDVNPSAGTQTLVARGVYRMQDNGSQTFQLHPGGWHFAAGHLAKLELLSQDSPYVRTSNGQFSISVSNLTLRLPVHEVPGAAGTPAAVVDPGGCTARPSSRLNKHALRLRRHRIRVVGTASERPCAQASAASRRKERVRTVYVSIFRGVGHGRCRYLLRNGRISRRRSCRRPFELRAHGTGHWRLNRRQHVPRGRWIVRSDAVDGFHRHQRTSRSSTARVRVR